MQRNSIYSILTISFLAFVLSGCYTGYGDKSKRNKEFAPNMYHSLPLEPYSQTTGDPVSLTFGQEEGEAQNSVFKNGLNAQAAPAGTVPRDMWYQSDVYMPYPYSNSIEGYDSATQYLFSPLANASNNEEKGINCTDDTFSKGKRIYETYCIMCHAADGSGNGILVSKGAYPKVPAYWERSYLTEGQMFHTLTYGKALMGSYASQLTTRERWEVVCYISQFLDDGATASAGE